MANAGAHEHRTNPRGSIVIGGGGNGDLEESSASIHEINKKLSKAANVDIKAYGTKT